jgi:hypothetical protein
MGSKTFVHKVFPKLLVLAIAISVVVVLSQIEPEAASGREAFRSPLPPLSAFDSPLSAPPVAESGPSEAARSALAYVAEREGIPVSALVIEDDHPTEYPASGRRFQVVTLVDERPEGEIYKLLVDLADGRIEENVSAPLAAEAQAQQARYGKLQPALYERLQTLRNNDVLPVAVWMAAQPGCALADWQAAAFATLASRYPQAGAALARSGKPMDVDDPELARRIEADYVALMNAEARARVQPLASALEQRGFAVTTFEGMPSFTAVLPKRVILELSRLEDVSAVYLIEENAHPELDSAVPTTLAPTVWGRGYDGYGVTIGILEHGNVDTNNSFLHHSPNSRPANNGVQDHTTVVASAAASFHGTYHGVASGATVLSAGHNGSQADAVDALQWAFDQDAKIVNISEGFEADNDIRWTDQAFDYWARQRFRLIVKSSGNTGGSITSPGKGWNVLTVGASDDNNTPDWSGDQMWTGSAYINPISPYNDREKPEIVAVGASVTALARADAIQTWAGTSIAAPQVAGLAALLIDRNSSLGTWPEATRAIIMASATHNITGPAIIVRGQGDLRDGAGAINADLADRVAQTRETGVGPCYTSCWWGTAIVNSTFPVGTYLTRTFYADYGDLIRVAISWWANADGPANNYSFTRLDTDLDLRVRGPGNRSRAYSTSWDNNYEMVQFLAPQTGQYTIQVAKIRADEDTNYLGIALVRIPLPYRVYLPLAMRNYP